MTLELLEPRERTRLSLADRRPSFAAITTLVPLPISGSSTRSPGSENPRIRSAASLSGIVAGWPSLTALRSLLLAEYGHTVPRH